MRDGIDQVIVDGVLTAESGYSKNTKMKIHQSSTQTLYTFFEAGIDGRIRSGDKLSFNGYVCDSGLPFCAPAVFIQQVQIRGGNRYITGRPWEGSHVGTYGNQCVSISREVNALLPHLKGVEIGQYTCSSRQFPPTKLSGMLSGTSKQSTLFRSELTVSGPPQSKDIYDKEACSVLRLFGVMLSASLYTKRTRYQFNDTGQVHHFWFNSSLGIGMSKVVHSPDEFITGAYPIWNSMDESMRKAIEVASTYIATSSEGYLDTRMFALFQAWEILARAYDAKENRSDERAEEKSVDRKNKRELAEHLTAAYETWRAKYPESNHNDIVDMGKLIESSQRIVSKDAVGFLVAQTGINPEALEFNIDGLRSISNDVRHTGMLRRQDRFGDDLDLYDETKFALLLIIFDLLGYHGRIKHHNESWPTYEPMTYYFGTAQEVAQYEEAERLESERLFDSM